MTHKEAAAIYDSSSLDDKRYYGVLGILFLSETLPGLIKFFRRVINEKNN